jgi:hypothetical protein
MPFKEVLTAVYRIKKLKKIGQDPITGYRTNNNNNNNKGKIAAMLN